MRLGHSVFTQRSIDAATMTRAMHAFAEIAEIIEEFEVQQYRAVATSAAREARNGRGLVRRVKSETGIDLEIIDGYEEARLVRTAVVKELGSRLSPKVILDLGGGSLDLSLLNAGAVEASYTLPIGTVRLMESCGIKGSINPDLRYDLESRILGVLHDNLPQRLNLAGARAVACGGNAEALQGVAPIEVSGRNGLDLPGLFEELDVMSEMGLRRRMQTYGVKRERAEVMAIAAIVLTTIGKLLGLEHLLVPGVGVREGTLEDLATSYFRSEGQDPHR